ncbi:hypothetical protein F2P81_019449 [Scophthalmus maximus]|uniref:Uncharacterized protein n=1 Tax=Scophthalmus maximus TaxID=52904 RepID=A0A6A4SCP6_SCOMX|nr:hypothetical protein F2P81_019449 [Scophthalmus maximus]
MCSEIGVVQHTETGEGVILHVLYSKLTTNPGLPLMNFSPSVYPGDALCVGAGTPTPEPLLSRNNVTGAKQHVGLRGLRHRTGIPETMQPFFGCG